MSFLVGIGALVIMILGAVCLGQKDYTPCGGSRTGALAMVLIGSIFEGPSIVVLIGACCFCCCAMCYLYNEEKKTPPSVGV